MSHRLTELLWVAPEEMLQDVRSIEEIPQCVIIIGAENLLADRMVPKRCLDPWTRTFRIEVASHFPFDPGWIEVLTLEDKGVVQGEVLIQIRNRVAAGSSTLGCRKCTWELSLLFTISYYILYLSPISSYFISL